MNLHGAGGLRLGQQFPMPQTGHEIGEGWDLQAGEFL